MAGSASGAGSDEMWRQAQMGRDYPAAWERAPANACLRCGRKTPAGEFAWIWGTGRVASPALRGLYCLGCGPPEGEPRGADIARAVRRSTGQSP